MTGPRGESRADTAAPPAGAAVADRNGDGRFRVLDSHRAFAGKIVTVRIDDVAMPGGTSARREVVEHMRAVAVVAIDADGDVVMIEQYRHPLRRRLWEIPAGLMDVPGEPPAVCAARELAEETSLAADRWSVLVDLASSPGFCSETIRVYLARDLRHVTSAPPRDEEADLRVVRVPLETAVAAVLDGRIVNATAVAGLLAAARVLSGPGAEGLHADGLGADGLGAAGVGAAGVGAEGLRAADDPWDGGPATVSTDPEVGTAPPLG